MVRLAKARQGLSFAERKWGKLGDFEVSIFGWLRFLFLTKMSWETQNQIQKYKIRSFS